MVQASKCEHMGCEADDNTDAAGALGYTFTKEGIVYRVYGRRTATHLIH